MASYHRQEDLYVARADTAGVWKLTQLTNDPARDRSPRWSPDGRQIAFSSNPAGAFSIWTINPDGSGARARAAMSQSLTYPLWSNDGLRLMASQLAARQTFVFALGDDVVRTPIETLPPCPCPDTSFSAVSWSPDGLKVAGWAGRTSAIWVYSFETKSYTKIVAGIYPVWLSDSRRLVYSSGGKRFLVDTFTKESREILAPRPSETLDDAHVTRDNRFLYYSHGTIGADIWLMTIK
jgi:Tol biopolymer transport system component